MNDTAFWDRIAPKYAKRPVGDLDAYETTLARVRTYLGADMNVLEFGCGTGTTALKLHESANRYVATDISAGMIEIAEGKLDGLTGNLPEFRVAGVDAGSYAGETFDAVLAFNLLHLLPDLETALADIHGMLPEGGLLISKTPAIGGRWYLRPVIKVMQFFGRAPFVRFLQVDEIDGMIKSAGFQIVETGLYPPTTPSRFVVARKV